MSMLFNHTVEFIRSVYEGHDKIGLHEPRLWGREKEYLNECVDSTYVSSVGKFVDRFEEEIAAFSESKFAVAVVNGTNALHLALEVCGVRGGDLVITQALSFVATSNAISFAGAKPLFIDVDQDTLGLSPQKLKDYLNAEVEIRDDGYAYHKKLGNRISACVPMHTFGFPCKIDEIVKICDQFNIALVEDAAEAVGSTYKQKAAGTFGKCGVYSFNGNKIITSGGGGVILTDDPELAKTIKHLSTVAKVPHAWKFEHDAIAYNYRMPNLNAALACAQLEQLAGFIKAKRELSMAYQQFFATYDNVQYVIEPEGAVSNYWLNSIIFTESHEQEDFLAFTNEKGIMTRPVWNLLSELEMYRESPSGDLTNSEWIARRLVSLPSTVPDKYR